MADPQPSRYYPARSIGTDAHRKFRVEFAAALARLAQPLVVAQRSGASVRQLTGKTDRHGSPMQARDDNTRSYDDIWTKLNVELRKLESCSGLAGALEALEIQQRDIGFIRDDLNAVKRYRFRDPEDSSRFFCVQYNPRRAQRFAGAGTMTAPPGATMVNDGCFLCRDNIRWQQRGIELGYDIDVGGSEYVAWMNAFPLMPVHTVIATRAHVPQAWCSAEEVGTGLSIDKLLSDLVALAGRLPGFIGFYNGEGAGASIPGHMHLQFFKRPENYGPFPLEAVAGHPERAPSNYPVAVVFWQGRSRDVVDQARRWITAWVESNSSGPMSISANIFAIADDADGSIRLYFVPRDQMSSHSPGMAGAVGGLEILGELVFSDPEEKGRLERGEVDYRTVERILASVNVPCDSHL
jgi:hypothetical protein